MSTSNNRPLYTPNNQQGQTYYLPTTNANIPVYNPSTAQSLTSSQSFGPTGGLNKPISNFAAPMTYAPEYTSTVSRPYTSTVSQPYTSQAQPQSYQPYSSQAQPTQPPRISQGYSGDSMRRDYSPVKTYQTTNNSTTPERYPLDYKLTRPSVTTTLQGPRELELFDSFLNSNDEYSSGLKEIIGQMTDNTLNTTEVLVNGHEALNQPENQYRLNSNRSTVDRIHTDLKRENLLYRQKVARLIDEFKSVLPPNQNNALQTAIKNFDSSVPYDNPEKTWNNLSKNKDDLVLILDKNITGLSKNKPLESGLARSKKADMSKVQNPSSVTNASVKIRLDPQDKYLNHEVTKHNAGDDVRVTIEKGQPIVRAPTTQVVYQQPQPPRQVYVPPVIMSPSPRVSEVYTDSPGRRKTPTKSRVMTGSAMMEEYKSPSKFEPIRNERPIAEIVRDFTPVNRQPVNKSRENVMVVQEEEEVVLPDRKKNILYSEPRNQQILKAAPRQDFFRNTETTSHQANDPEAHKLELNNQGDALYLSGGQGVTKMAVNGDKLSVVPQNQKRVDQKGISLKKNLKDNMLVHLANSNDISIMNDDLQEKGRTNGNKEDGQINENYNHYRHSLDDRYILWRNGHNDLSVYDCEALKNDEVIKNFWDYKAKSTAPVAAISNREVSKILALSQLDPNTQVIHYLEKDEKLKNHKSEFLMRDIFPRMRKLTTMEVNSDGTTAYIAGQEESNSGPDRLKVMAVSFDRNLRILSDLELNSMDYQRINRMKRVKGEETLVLGCNKHFSLLDVENRNMKEVANIPDVHSGDILDFELRDKYLYSKGSNESDVKVTTFGVKKEVIVPVDPPKRPGSPKPIVFKQSKYESFKRTKIDCPFITDPFEKLCVSGKGNRLYAGGKGLYIFEKDEVDEMKYKVLTYEGNDKKMFFGLKGTVKGYVLIQEQTSNDMVLLDETGDELQRFKGSNKAIFKSSETRNPHFTGDKEFIAWFSGTTSISIMSMRDMTYTEMKGFLPSNGKDKDGIPLRAVMKDAGKSILTYFIIEDIFALSILHGNTEPDNLMLEEVLPSFKSLVDMELSTDQSVVFMGGSANELHPSSQKSKAILAAVRFDKSLETIHELKLNDVDARVVSCVKRGNSDNILFAGCYKSVFVIEWKDNKFVPLMVALDVHSHIIYDMQIVNNKLYTIGNKDKYISILHFDFAI